MPKICSIQEFIEQATVAICKLSPEEKRELRQAWLAHYDRELLQLTQADLRWLREIKINPCGD